MRENKTCLLKELKEMTTLQLEEKLQEEIGSEFPDERVILPILEVLEERDETAPVEITEDHLAAWEKFEHHTVSVRKPARAKRGVLKALVAAAAVLCILISVIPGQVGAENLFDRLVRFADGVFQFFDLGSDPGNLETEYVFTTDNSGLQQLYDKMTELGVTAPVVPMWLPEGYELEELKVVPFPTSKRVHARFVREASTIVISFKIPEDATYIQYEKDLEMEVYEIAGVAHAIVDNKTFWSAAWATDGTECLIAVDTEKEILFEILKSIYRRSIE